jgi:hypothetical protein
MCTSLSVHMHTVSNDTELGEALRAMGHKLTDAEVLKMMKVWQFICIYLCIYLCACACEVCLCAKGSIWYRYMPVHVLYQCRCACVRVYMHACMFARMMGGIEISLPTLPPSPPRPPPSLPSSVSLSCPLSLSLRLSFSGSIVRSLARSLHTLSLTLLI